MLVLLGANQQELARSLGLDLAGTGQLAAALSAGLGVGVVVAGPLVDRYPRRPTWLGAMLVSALALLAFDAEMDFARALACSALVGFGIGIYETLLSTLVAERYLERAARPMAMVHAGATLGAVSCPLLVGLVAPRWGWPASFHWAGVAHLVLAGAILFARLPAPPTLRAAPARLGAVLRPALLPFAVVSFAYVGIETTLTLFALPYAGEALDLGASSGRAGISAFWAGLLAGRLGVLAMPGALDARLLAGSGVVAAALLGGGAALGLRPVELYFGSVGMAIGFVFPLMVALAGLRFPEARGQAVGAVTGAGCLGGFALPWLHGAVGDAWGVGVAVGGLAIWGVALAAAAWRVWRKEADSKSRPTRSEAKSAQPSEGRSPSE